MKYPIKFILPAEKYKSVSIHSNDFPVDIDLQLDFCDRNHYFVKTIDLPSGVYRYQFLADGEIVHDQLRAPKGGEAILILGSETNQGVIFDLAKSFVKNNHLVLMIGLNSSLWTQATLNIQTLKGLEIIHGKNTFFEGSSEYQMFVVDIPQEESLLAYFELTGYEKHAYYGVNGLKESEWAVDPFEINEHHSPPITPSNIMAIYHLPTPKSIQDFEKHHSYFDKFPIDRLAGDIPAKSPLLKKYPLFEEGKTNKALTCLLRDIFLETEDFNPSIGLLGRFAYEYRQDIATIPFSLSDDQISFWNLTRRSFPVAMRGIGFQLLGSMTPKILFGEEIGLVKTGTERNMYWTKIKWNKDLFHLYQKLLKLRKKYPVLRQGRFRMVLQDCCVWGIERYMDGEDSIYIFGNHSKNNIIIDLTKIMNCTGPIIELLTEHPLKRKKVCTIFGDSLAAFKQNSSKKIKNGNDLLLEDDLEDDEE